MTALDFNGIRGRDQTRVTGLAVLISVLFAAPATAQFGPSPAAAGTAGAYQQLARGQEALDWNPANLGSQDAPGWSVALLQPSATGTVLGPDWGDFLLLREEEITLAEQQDFLSEVDAGGLNFTGNVRLQGLAVSYGSFAVGVSGTLLANANASRELLELYLDTRRLGGIDPSRILRYRVGDTSARDAVYYTVEAAWGRRLREELGLPFSVSVGIGARLIRGSDLQRARMFEPTIDLANESLFVAIGGLQSTGGTGFGVDAGVTAQPRPGLSVGLSLRNLLRGMSWDDDLRLRFAEYDDRELSRTDPEDLLKRLESRPLDPDLVPEEALDVLREGFMDHAHPPTVIGLGAAYRTGGTGIGATFRSTVGAGDLHAGWPLYLAGGVEQALSVLRLRGGLATSFDAVLYSLGVGLVVGPVRLDIAGARAHGHGEGVAGSTAGANRHRFAERLNAGSGWAVNVGLSATSR